MNLEDLLAQHRIEPGALLRFMDSLSTEREINVGLSRSMYCRLVRHIESVNRDLGDDPWDTDRREDLAEALLAVADRGLVESESEDGVWSDASGECHPLPRVNRSPWHRRLRFAWEAGVRTWRAT